MQPIDPEYFHKLFGDSAKLKQFEELISSPHMKQMQELINSPAMRKMQEDLRKMQEGLKKIRDIQKPVKIKQVCAIDPGNVESAYVFLCNKEIIDKGLVANEDLRSLLLEHEFVDTPVACEFAKPRGMPASYELFLTCEWVGRFHEICIQRGIDFHHVDRHDVKMHCCKNARATDSNVMNAMIDLFGPKGTKKAPGVTFGFHDDLWQSLAVGVTFLGIS